MESLAQLFYDEANEMMEQMETILLSMEANGTDPEIVNALFRYAHSLKGNSGAMGFTQISKFTHGLENALDVLRKGSKVLTKDMNDVLLKGVDVLRNLLDKSRTEGDVGDPECEIILTKIKDILSGDPPSTACANEPSETENQTTSAVNSDVQPTNHDETSNEEAATIHVHFIPGETLNNDNDPFKALSELSEYAEVHSSSLVEQIPLINELNESINYGEWDIVLSSQFGEPIIKAVLELSSEGAQTIFSSNDNLSTDVVAETTADEQSIAEQASASQAQPNANAETQEKELAKPSQTASAQQTANRKNAESQTIRVSTDKVDALFNLTSEIVIAQSMLMNAQARIYEPELKMAIVSMERHVRELHERVMAIRMIPVGYVFSRFPRMVRDLASSSHKDIHLEIYGEETELDRTLLESLTDPLTHLLRNSIDHGIETPDERIKAGKPKTGLVKLGAFQAEGRIHIEVFDDGKGLNLDKIKAKAVKLGWLREDESVTNEQLYEFIFKPGFSTADVVSDVSGRGVGMDVVKRNVEALGGMVSVSSEIGKGSRFIIKVPLTLAIMDGLNLRVGTEYFIVPLTSVVETFRPEAVGLSSALNQFEMVNVRGKFLPLVKLSDMFSIQPDSNISSDGLLVILEQDELQVAILVDEIVGQHQVVMKSLEANFERVPGFSGATILGDGHVALIVDVGDIIRNASTSVAINSNDYDRSNVA